MCDIKFVDICHKILRHVMQVQFSTVTAKPISLNRYTDIPGFRKATFYDDKTATTTRLTYCCSVFRHTYSPSAEHNLNKLRFYLNLFFPNFFFFQSIQWWQISLSAIRLSIALPTLLLKLYFRVVINRVPCIFLAMKFLSYFSLSHRYSTDRTSNPANQPPTSPTYLRRKIRVETTGHFLWPYPPIEPTIPMVCI